VRARLSVRARCDIARRVAQAASMVGKRSGGFGEVRNPNGRGARPARACGARPSGVGGGRGTDWGDFMEMGKVKTMGR
jgi:hypothetical protein